MFNEIPHRILTKSEKSFCKSQLIPANMLFKKYEVHYEANEFHTFRAKVLGGDPNPLGKIPPTQIKALGRDAAIILEIRYKKHPELENRSVEEAILQGHAAMCKNHARKWSLHFGDSNNGVTYRDYLQEAYTKVLESMYMFTRADIEMTTFFWWCLHHRMISVTNSQGFFHLTNEELEMVVKYEKTRDKSNRKMNFDEIVAAMGLSEEDSIHLGNILSKVISESQILFKSSHQSEGNEGGDYTGFRANTFWTANSNNNEESLDRAAISHAIKIADLTDFEKQLIEAEMYGYHGWQIEFARNTFNPKTNKPYSRMWITLCLQSAHDKLKKHLVKDYAFQEDELAV